jgi:hypothetical protein
MEGLLSRARTAARDHATRVELLRLSNVTSGAIGGVANFVEGPGAKAACAPQ